MDHLAAIEKGKRSKRLASATTSDEKQLASVETAVIASATELDALSKKLDGEIAADLKTKTVAANELVTLKAQIKIRNAEMRTNIVEPIQKRSKAQAQATAFVKPDRTANHRELSQRYIDASYDEKERMLSRATTGKEDVLLTEALLTGEHGFQEVTENLFIRKLAPLTDDKSQSEAMTERVNATIKTLEGAHS